jgi:HEPN domain-containing protein
MPEPDKAAVVAREWIAKADNDLKTASHTLKLGVGCPTDTVCFHAQQYVEKCLKAGLILLGIAFPRTHDIEVLIGLMPKHVHFPLTVEQQRRLTEYATVMRYPGPYDIPKLSEAKEAVRLARRIRREVRKLIEDKPLF